VTAKGKRTLARADHAKAPPAPKVTAKADLIPEEKPFVAPKIRKKGVSDDPLGGLMLPAKAM
jgi:hypothetical protein